MAETLGMLCDKLTIIKLKQYHTTDTNKLESLAGQAAQLQLEIDDFVTDAVHGLIPLNKLTFAANKVYKKEGNEVQTVAGTLGHLFFQLADVNCRLWHEVDKGYQIEQVPVAEKDQIVKSLAVLNLERNEYIDLIDRTFQQLISNK
jgi:hypothetical protein